ncbi:MAG: DUF1475 family protein [Halofilum sp. (in: g-proteobacteria)]
MNDPLLPGRALRLLAGVCLLLLAAVLVYAVGYGYAWAQLGAIASIAWGQVLLVDLYVGFALFAAWMLWREGPGLAAAIWIVALLTLGNLVSCIYIFNALYQARRDGHRFWHGRRAPGLYSEEPAQRSAL